MQADANDEPHPGTSASYTLCETLPPANEMVTNWCDSLSNNPDAVTLKAVYLRETLRKQQRSGDGSMATLKVCTVPASPPCLPSFVGGDFWLRLSPSALQTASSFACSFFVFGNSVEGVHRNVKSPTSVSMMSPKRKDTTATPRMKSSLRCLRRKVEGYMSTMAPQKDDHDEEAAGPQRGERHHGHGTRIRDEGQTRT
ncbi:hypothetical protein EYF80_022326 [Liparis tanakae]|uniref:Uncharacterized protein n=1 Tax=Liparis tanakae TaxID=230148 RepID=A0A4Z2HP81_9TELE|nr:hypothetical protein EYF80_022326 [Liparis tanakae]